MATKGEVVGKVGGDSINGYKGGVVTRVQASFNTS